jgi:peptide/nickel transport system substrate-binding protein
LIDEARRTVDEGKRMPIWQQAEKIIYEDQPYTFLMRRKSLLFVDKRIHNLQMTKLGLNLGLLPLENYVPLAQQKYTQ